MGEKKDTGDYSLMEDEQYYEDVRVAMENLKKEKCGKKEQPAKKSKGGVSVTSILLAICVAFGGYAIGGYEGREAIVFVESLQQENAALKEELAEVKKKCNVLTNKNTSLSQQISYYDAVVTNMERSVSTLKEENEELKNQKKSEEKVEAKAPAATYSTITPILQKPSNEYSAPSYSSSYVTSYVWIPRTGSKYHAKSSCSNMNDPSYVSINEAIYLGYDPCSKCY